MIDFKFCPYCKNKIKCNKGIYTCKGCKKTYYVHSSITASFIPMKDGEVLLAKRKGNPFKGYWDAIGGFVNYGEHPKKGALREVKEETDLKVKIEKFIGLYMDDYLYMGTNLKTLNFVYSGKIISGNLTPKDDVSELKWFNINKLPKKLAFKCIPNALSDLQKWYNTHTHGE